MLVSSPMKCRSEHEVDIQMMRGGRRIRIIGSRPTIMLSVNEVFRGWYEDTDHAWNALQRFPNPLHKTKLPLERRAP